MGLQYREIHCGSAAQGSPLWSRNTKKSNVVRTAHGSPLCGRCTGKSVVRPQYREVHCGGAAKGKAIVGMQCNEVYRAAEKQCESYMRGRVGNYVSPNMDAI